MTKAKGKARQQRRLKQIDRAQEVDDPREEPSQVYTDTYHLDTEGLHVARERVVYGSRRQVIDFALTQQYFDRGRWCDVVRYDSSHTDEVHKHIFRKGPDEPIELDKVTRGNKDHLEDSLDGAWVEIQADWKANVRRYHGARRKSKSSKRRT